MSKSLVKKKQHYYCNGASFWKQPLVLHLENGAPMKSVTLLTKMHDLGITTS